mgnify:CR=1 FL=1
MSKATASLANFNCTLKINNETLPMLEFFQELLYPALNDKTLYKETKTTKYYIADIKLIKLENGPYALIGKHIKRTILDIFPDYHTNTGFVGKHSQSPSAPDADFILLLNNHRVIYYTDKKGAPTVSSFGSTIRCIVNKYISRLRDAEMNSLKEISRSEALKLNLVYTNEKSKTQLFYRYEHRGKYYKNLVDFKTRYLDMKLPYPEINVVAIESPTLISEAFKNLQKIKKVEFKCYKLNNEALDADDMFANLHDILEKTGSNSVTNTLRSPENKEVIQNALTSSKGKTDYKVEATTNDGEPITISPSSVSEKVQIDIISNDDIEKNASFVYNQLKEKTSIKEISESNLDVYIKQILIISSLMD